MKRLNLSLTFGGIIIVIIIIIMAFPWIFTSLNPYGGESLKSIALSSGRYVVNGAPFPPSSQYILGSDELGRDVYTLIIYGTRLTITLGILITIGRFLVALPVGIAAGLGNGFCRVIINQFIIIFSAIPALLISIIVLQMNFFTGLYKNDSIIAFVIVLTIVGFAKLGSIICERTEDILSKPFITGEMAIGKSKLNIILQNILPHLAPELIVMFFMEVASSLTIIAQLGIFSVFVGNLRILDDILGSSIAGSPKILKLSFEPEWASMLGAASQDILSSPWIVLCPTLAFFISIFGFNLFGDGLRSILQKRDSMFIPKMRRLFNFERNDFKLSSLNIKRGRFRGITLIAIVLAAIFTINSLQNLKYNFNSSKLALSTSLSLPDEVIVGKAETKPLSNIIEAAFKENGYLPISSNGFITEYSIGNMYYATDNVSVLGGKGNYKLTPELDYYPYTFNNFNISGKVYDSTNIDLFSLKNYKIFNNKIVIINGNIYSKSAMDYFADKIMKDSSAKGILLLRKEGENIPSFIGNNVSKIPTLCITKESLKHICSGDYISISQNSKKLTNKGRNVIGILPGKDQNLKKRAIMIGLSYNYTSRDKQIGGKGIQFSLELIKRLSKIKSDRSIILAFFDGTINDSCSGARYYSKNTLFEPDKTDLYVDLTKLNTSSVKKLSFNSSLCPSSKYFAWSFSHTLKTTLENNVTLKDYGNIRTVNELSFNTPTADESMYYTGSIATVIASMDKKEYTDNNGFNLDKLGKILLMTLEKNKY